MGDFTVFSCVIGAGRRWTPPRALRFCPERVQGVARQPWGRAAGVSERVVLLAERRDDELKVLLEFYASD